MTRVVSVFARPESSFSISAKMPSSLASVSQFFFALACSRWAVPRASVSDFSRASSASYPARSVSACASFRVSASIFAPSPAWRSFSALTASKAGRSPASSDCFAVSSCRRCSACSACPRVCCKASSCASMTVRSVPVWESSSSCRFVSRSSSSTTVSGGVCSLSAARASASGSSVEQLTPDKICPMRTFCSIRC